LGGNAIKEIPERAFENMPRLRVILLQSNNLTRIPDQAFKNQTTLEVIMLSDNPVEIIGSDAISTYSNPLVYAIRTNIKTISLRSFHGIQDPGFTTKM
ncbi:unnamed protein product, partial [Porites lobata]